MPPRLDREQAAARGEAAGERREHAAHFEVRPHARAPRLRGKYQVVVLEDPAGLGNHAVEQELVIFAVDDQHRRTHHQRVATRRARPRLPAAGQRAVELIDLLSVFVRRATAQPHLLPVECGGQLGIARHQPRRLGIVEIGDHEHRGRMLEQAVGQLLEPEAHVFEADLLGDHEHRHGRELAMRAAHDTRDHRAVAHAGVEQAHRRRRRPQQCHLVRGAARDRRFLVAGGDERQVLLAVVVEAERRRAGAVAAAGAACGAGAFMKVAPLLAPQAARGELRALDQ